MKHSEVVFILKKVKLLRRGEVRLVEASAQVKFTFVEKEIKTSY